MRRRSKRQLAGRFIASGQPVRLVERELLTTKDSKVHEANPAGWDFSWFMGWIFFASFAESFAIFAV